MVTETDDLAVVLDAAAQRWPTLSRAQLLVRLAVEGHRAAERGRDERRDSRLAVLEKHEGVLTGTYGPHHLAELREDWPA